MVPARKAPAPSSLRAVSAACARWHAARVRAQVAAAAALPGVRRLCCSPEHHPQAAQRRLVEHQARAAGPQRHCCPAPACNSCLQLAAWRPQPITARRPGCCWPRGELGRGRCGAVRGASCRAAARSVAGAQTGLGSARDSITAARKSEGSRYSRCGRGQGSFSNCRTSGRPVATTQCLAFTR